MTVTCTWTCEGNSLLLWTKVSGECVWNSHVLIVLKQIIKNSLNILNGTFFFSVCFYILHKKYYCVLHWFKWNIQIMWYPEPYLDSIITKYDFIQEGLGSKIQVTFPHCQSTVHHDTDKWIVLKVFASPKLLTKCSIR